MSLPNHHSRASLKSKSTNFIRFVVKWQNVGYVNHAQIMIIHNLDPIQFLVYTNCTVSDRPKCWITFVRRRTAGDATGLDDKILASLVDERAALLEWIDETWLLNVLRDLGRVEDSWEYFSLVDTEKTQQKGTNMQQRNGLVSSISKGWIIPSACFCPSRVANKESLAKQNLIFRLVKYHFSNPDIWTIAWLNICQIRVAKMEQGWLILIVSKKPKKVALYGNLPMNNCQGWWMIRFTQR